MKIIKKNWRIRLSWLVFGVGFCLSLGYLMSTINVFYIEDNRDRVSIIIILWLIVSWHLVEGN